MGEKHTSMYRHNPVRSVLMKALDQARQSNAKQVRSLRFAIGEISEIDPRSVREQWDQLSRGTPGERAQLDFHLIEAEVQCMACFQKYYPSDGKILCPYCGSFGAKILSGEEFYLESIELDDE